MKRSILPKTIVKQIIKTFFNKKKRTFFYKYDSNDEYLSTSMKINFNEATNVTSI